MKKINSIDVGGKVLIVIALFVMGMPLMGWASMQLGLVKVGVIVIKGSLGIGGILVLGAFILLIIELRQDKKLAGYYDQHTDSKRKLSGGGYECQNCGNRQLNAEDEQCPVCGVTFKEYTDRPPYSSKQGE